MLEEEKSGWGRRTHPIVGSMQRKCSIFILLIFVQHFILCVTFSLSLSLSVSFARSLILDQQHFFIHNAYDTCVFIGHTSIRYDKNDNDLHQLCACVFVCRRLTKQKFKYHLRLKWKTGWQQQQQHPATCFCEEKFTMKWNGSTDWIENGIPSVNHWEW